jgi:predicted ATP-grasp superfamily ATP-dependent carboligase/ubiquinone/menaquinone biosynthesis C-methylase UbiE
MICPGVHGLGVARSLGRLGIPVFGVFADPQFPNASSRYWRSNYFWDLSTATPEDSVNWLLDLAHKIGSRPILIPSSDHSCQFVDDNAESLLQGYQFPKQPAGLTRALSNKRKLYALCKQMSVLTAETAFPQSRDDVIQFIKKGIFPIMLKGIDTIALYNRTGMRMVLVNDGESLLKRYDEMETPGTPSLMLQEYIPGGAENVWMFDGYFDSESNCRFGITARKLRQYPAYTGMTSLGECQTNKTVYNLVINFMKAIGYNGILDIGYKYNPTNGKYYLLDPNPRLGLSFRLFVDSIDMDVVKVLYCDMTGQPIRTGNLVEGRKWLSEPFDIVSSFRYWRDGNLKLGNWLQSFRGVQEAEWYARDDMDPFWSVWKYSAGRLFKAKSRTTDTVSRSPEQFEKNKKNVNAYFSAESSNWNEIYQKKDLYSVIYQDRRSATLKYFHELSLPTDVRILEIGCGAGMTTVDIAREGYYIEAVDSVEAMIRQTRQNAVEFGVEKQVHANVMDAYSLQFPDQTFHLVVALGVVPWLTDLTRALKEITRVLTPDGYILMTMDNHWRLNYLLDPVEFPPFAGLKTRLRLFLEKVKLRKPSVSPRSKRHTTKEFTTLLESAGFIIRDHQTIGFGPFTFLRISLFPGAFGVRLHRILQNAANRDTPILRSTGSQYLVLVQKK